MSSVTGNSRALSPDERRDQEWRLTYVLANHVPTMGRDGFSIFTTYGEIHFEGRDAAWLEFQVEILLSARLRALQEEF